MIKVEVANTRIWTPWLRKNCQSGWKMKLGTDVDYYYFESDDEAKKFKSHSTQWEYRLKQIIKEQSTDR